VSTASFRAPSGRPLPSSPATTASGGRRPYGPAFGLPPAFSGHNGYCTGARRPRPPTPSSRWAFPATSWSRRSETSGWPRGWTITFASPTANRARRLGVFPARERLPTLWPRFRSLG